MDKACAKCTALYSAPDESLHHVWCVMMPPDRCCLVSSVQLSQSPAANKEVLPTRIADTHIYILVNSVFLINCENAQIVFNYLLMCNSLTTMGFGHCQELCS